MKFFPEKTERRRGKILGGFSGERMGKYVRESEADDQFQFARLTNSRFPVAHESSRALLHPPILFHLA